MNKIYFVKYDVPYEYEEIECAFSTLIKVKEYVKNKYLKPHKFKKVYPRTWQVFGGDEGMVVISIKDVKYSGEK